MQEKQNSLTKKQTQHAHKNFPLNSHSGEAQNSSKKDAFSQLKAIPNENRIGVYDETKKYAYDKAVLTWDAPEFIKHERGFWWFLIAGLAVCGIVVYSIITDAWSTAASFLALSGVFYMYHNHEPRMLKVTISEIGIKVGNREIPYSIIKYFWIVYDPPHVKTLHLATSNRFLSEVVIQLHNQDPAGLRNYLVQQLPEVTGKEENFVHLLTRLLKLS